jgi:hypothetical protein
MILVKTKNYYIMKMNVLNLSELHIFQWEVTGRDTKGVIKSSRVLCLLISIRRISWGRPVCVTIK